MLRVLLFFLYFTSLLFSSTFEIKNENIYNKFQLHYLKDETSALTIEEIKQKEFTQIAKNNFNLGYFKGTVWFKFDLNNHTDFEDFILTLNETFYETANLYYQPNEKMVQLTNSLFTFIRQRDVKSNHLAFNLNLPKDKEMTIYLELKAKYAYFGKVEVYEKKHFYLKQSMGINTLFTFALGIIFVLIFFTLFLYTKTKEKIYLYYLGYSFFLFIYFSNINGLLVFINLQKYIYDLKLSAAFMIGFLILFSKEYLQTKEYMKRFDKILGFLSLPFFIFGILVVYSYQPWNKLINNSSGLICIILIVASSMIYFKEHHQTKYYIFAMVTYFASVVVFTFMVNGLFEYSFFTRYGFVFGVVAEMILFSYLLANRYHLMKQDIQTYLEKEVEKQTDELNVLLNERELLLKEVYHRVKNNFHMLIGILHLENEKQNNFTELIHRVKSMSLIHEYLYVSDNLSQIALKEYLEKIITNIKMSYSHIPIHFTIQNVFIHIDSALSLGVIVNEVLTNSIKHNKDLQNLELTIGLFRDGNTIVLNIQDNGKGFPNETHKGLGLKLISQFAKKLKHSQHDFSFEKGCKFVLKF